MLKLAVVPRYFRVLAVASVVPGVLMAGLLAPSQAAANCCVSVSPTLVGPSVSGTAVTLSGGGYTPNGSVQITEYAIVPGVPGATPIVSYFTTTANLFHYVCHNGYCYRVYGDFYIQLPVSPCAPYEVEYEAKDLSSGVGSDWTYWQTLC